MFRCFAAALAALAIVSTATPVLAEDPYEINSVLSLTGGAAFLGSRELQALRAMETLVNKTGGVRGRAIRFNVLDDQSNPQVGVQLMNQLSAKGVPVVFGPTLTPVCQAVMPLVEQKGPLTYCLSPVIFPKAGSFVMMGAPAFDDVQPVVIRYLKSRGFTRLGLLMPTDAGGQDFEKRLESTLAKPEFGDVTLVAREHFAPGDISIAAQVARLRAASPQALLTFSVGAPFGTVLRGLHDGNLDIPVYGSGGNYNVGQMQEYRSFLPTELLLNGVRGIKPEANASAAVRRAQAFYATALHDANLQSDYVSAIPWDAMMAVLEVVRRAGFDAGAEQMRRELQNLKGWSGIEGTYDYQTYGQRGVGEAAVAMFRYDVARGDFVQVYPQSRR